MSLSLSAAIIIIGDEILSGRTRDINIQTIAQFLEPLGISVAECRIIPDIKEKIVSTVNAMRREYTYVFTTGGIGPTHDDITADSVAAAFGVDVGIRDDARAILETRYAENGIELTSARLRMARIPDGASLIANPVSGAPGFQLENVFVLAGVPSIVRGMLLDVEHRLKTGVVTTVSNVKCPGLREGDIAESLSKIAEAFPSVSVGSYPWYTGPNDSGVNIVIRGKDAELVRQAAHETFQMIEASGIQPDSDQL